VCIGGPADGEMVEDVGPYLRMHKHRDINPLFYTPMEKLFELVVYVKIRLQRKDGGIITVYEAEGTDSLLEMWDFYLKGKHAVSRDRHRNDRTG
jgi:hypothetical protein